VSRISLMLTDCAIKLLLRVMNSHLLLRQL